MNAGVSGGINSLTSSRGDPKYNPEDTRESELY